MNRLLLNKLFLLILLFGISFLSYSQHDSANLSSKKSVKKYFKGDWYFEYIVDTENYKLEKTIKYTFGFMKKYKYSGFWTQEHANSTDEIIELKLN